MAFRDDDWLGTANSGASYTGGFDNNLPPNPAQYSKGSLHIALTIVSLLAASLASVLLAYITKNIQQRPVWLMGLIFMAPAVSVLIGALIVEDRTAAMTPRFNRGAQAVVALITALVSFMVGSLGDLLYIQGFTQPSNIIFLMDRSSSMRGSDPLNESARAVSSILSTMSDASRAGLVSFSDDIVNSVPFARLTQEQREKIHQGLETEPNGYTNFFMPINVALTMVEGAGMAKGSKTTIVLVTDGIEEGVDFTQQLSVNAVDVIARCAADGVSICCVKLKDNIDFALADVVQRSGGQGVIVDNASQLAGGMTTVSAHYHDLLRDREPASVAIAGALFVLEGLALGIALSLMLSHQRQKRFQLLLSPLMGVIAFLICKPLAYPLVPAWVNEAIMFALFGIVLMRKNRMTSHGNLVDDSKSSAGDIF